MKRAAKKKKNTPSPAIKVLRISLTFPFKHDVSLMTAESGRRCVGCDGQFSYSGCRCSGESKRRIDQFIG